MENDEALLLRVRQGQLAQVLKVLPPERWTEEVWIRAALDHHDNAPSLPRLLDAGARWGSGIFSILYMASPGPILEVLCARASPDHFRTMFMFKAYGSIRSARCFIKHGARLSHLATEHNRTHFPLEIWYFEQAVLRCRAAVAALLRVKRVAKVDYRWDQLLLAEIARTVWMSRDDDIWTSEAEWKRLFEDEEDMRQIQRKEHEIRQLKKRRDSRTNAAFKRK